MSYIPASVRTSGVYPHRTPRSCSRGSSRCSKDVRGGRLVKGFNTKRNPRTVSYGHGRRDLEARTGGVQ